MLQDAAKFLKGFLFPRFPSREQERHFVRANTDRRFATRRFFAYFGVFIFLIHGALDYAAAGDVYLEFLVARLIAVTIMLSLATWLSLTPTGEKTSHDAIISLYLVVPAIAIIAMTVIAEPGTAADTYPFGLVILMAYGGSVLVPSTSHLVTLCTATFICFMVSANISAISNGAMVVNGFFLTVGLAAICIGSAVRENLERRAMLSRQSILKLNADLERTKTEAIRARDEAIDARQAQSNFIATVSHELRTPLNAIIGFSDLMRNEIHGPIQQPTYRDYINDINTSGQALNVIVDDILDLQRLKTQKMAWADERFNVQQAIRNAIMMTRTTADEKQITITAPPALPELDAYGNGLRLSQAITNLLTNAVKFSTEQTEIKILHRITTDGEYRLTISDQGIGIPKIDIPRIIKPFEQAEQNATLSKENNGLGLGLSIVKQILTKMEYDFQIDSEVGVGTNCHITIPPSHLFLDENEMDQVLAQ